MRASGRILVRGQPRTAYSDPRLETADYVCFFSFLPILSQLRIFCQRLPMWQVYAVFQAGSKDGPADGSRDPLRLAYDYWQGAEVSRPHAPTAAAPGRAGGVAGAIPRSRRQEDREHVLRAQRGGGLAQRPAEGAGTNNWALGFPEGRKLEQSDTPANWLGTIRPDVPATDDTIRYARGFALQANADESAREGPRSAYLKRLFSRFRPR